MTSWWRWIALATSEERYERYVMGQEILGRKPKNISKIDFMAGLRQAEEIAEQAFAFGLQHQDLQQMYLSTKVENIELQARVRALENDLQRLFVLFEDPEG